MKPILPLTLVGVALWAGSLSTFAADQGNMFVTVNLGPSLLQDSDWGEGGITAQWNIGLRLDAGFGYHVTPEISIGAETGLIWNQLDSLSFRGHTESVPSELDYNLYQIPLLADVVYHIPLQDEHWKPYVGIGAGGVSSIFAVSSPHEDETGTAFTFAYQLKAGVGYAFNENMQVDFGYKFLGTLDQEWDFDPGKLDGGNLYSHSLLVSFTWLF